MAEMKNQGRKVIQCPCGFLVEGDGEQTLVANAQEHARREHGMELTPEQALAMARPA
jgi:predicted small metal-binding protein